MAREVILRVTGDAGGLTRAFKEADKQAAASMAKIEASVKNANAKMASTIDAGAGKIGKLKASLAENAAALSIAERDQVRLTSKFGEGSVQADKAALAVRRLAGAHAFTRAELIKAEAAEAASLAMMNQRESRWKTMGSTIAGVGSTAASRLGAVPAALGAVGAKMTATGRTMTRSVSLPMAVIGGLGLKTAMDYERNMNILQQASGATGDQMGQFSKLASALGADMLLPGTSAADAAAAMVELSKAGLSVGDTMGAARGVLQLSAAGGLDNATSAMVAANALNAFKLSGDQATRVADLLAGAANGSSASVAGLADSLQMGASVFAAAGVPIEDFITSAALMSNVGISGSDAGTALKTMLQRLQNPTKEAAGMMRQMGIDIYDAQGRMRPFRDLIGQFTGATAGMTQEQRDAAVATIFGADAVRSSNAVLQGGVAVWDKMKAVTTEQGAAAKAAAARNKGLGGALDGLKSAMETLALKVMVPALPVVTRMVNAVSNFLPKLAALPKPVLVAAAAFAGLMVALGPIGMLLGAVFSGPAVAAAAAITALGLAIYAALNPEKAGAIVNQIKEKWNELSPGMFAALGRLWDTVSSWLAVHGPVIAAQVWEWAKAFFGWVAKVVPPLLVELGHLLGALGTWILDVAVPWATEEAKKLIPAFTDWAQDVAPGVMSALHEMLKTIVTWIATEAIPKIAAAFGRLITAIPQGIVSSLYGGEVGGPSTKESKANFVADIDRRTGTAAPAGASFDTAAGGNWAGGRRPIGMAKGGLLLGLNRPTPILAGEGRGKEDVLAVPHSKGGIGALGGVTQNNTFVGIPYEEAAERSNRQLGWRMALSSTRR